MRRSAFHRVLSRAIPRSPSARSRVSSWLRQALLGARLPPLAGVERVWSHLKRSLANLTKHTITELTALVKTRLRRMQYRPELLAGFLASTGLDLGPFL